MENGKSGKKLELGSSLSRRFFMKGVAAAPVAASNLGKVASAAAPLSEQALHLSKLAINKLSKDLFKKAAEFAENTLNNLPGDRFFDEAIHKTILMLDSLAEEDGYQGIWRDRGMVSDCFKYLTTIQESFGDISLDQMLNIEEVYTTSQIENTEMNNRFHNRTYKLLSLDGIISGNAKISELLKVYHFEISKKMESRLEGANNLRDVFKEFNLFATEKGLENSYKNEVHELLTLFSEDEMSEDQIYEVTPRFLKFALEDRRSSLELFERIYHYIDIVNNFIGLQDYLMEDNFSSFPGFTKSAQKALMILNKEREFPYGEMYEERNSIADDFSKLKADNSVINNVKSGLDRENSLADKYIFNLIPLKGMFGGEIGFTLIQLAKGQDSAHYMKRRVDIRNKIREEIERFLAQNGDQTGKRYNRFDYEVYEEPLTRQFVVRFNNPHLSEVDFPKNISVVSQDDSERGRERDKYKELVRQKEEEKEETLKSLRKKFKQVAQKLKAVEEHLKDGTFLDKSVK